MINPYYVVIRLFRDRNGFFAGKPNRFESLEDAMENALAFANDVLPQNNQDKIIVGHGVVKGGLPAGRWHLIARYSWKNGEVVFKDFD